MLVEMDTKKLTLIMDNIYILFKFKSPHVRWLDSGILGFEIPNSGQEIQNPANDSSLESKVLLPSNPESSTWNSESKVGYVRYRNDSIWCLGRLFTFGTSREGAYSS